mmetsp:Transcript_25721/g.34361  ORF Transcript_25721/g.34361 Transcript_25721/m.34361 type:complete len:83 (-) Transcript_25721:627-875(-)
MSPELCRDMGLASDSEEEELVDEWPDYFEVDQVPRLLKAVLKPKPRLKSMTSVGNLLQDYNIREQLDRKMMEFESSSQHNRR